MTAPSFKKGDDVIVTFSGKVTRVLQRGDFPIRVEVDLAAGVEGMDPDLVELDLPIEDVHPYDAEEAA